jgi:hypothetical protein
MQLTLKNAPLLVAATITLFNCSSPETSLETVPVQMEIMDFKGEKVMIDSSFPKALFNQSQEEFDKYYTALKANSDAREAGGEGNWTYNEINSLLSPYTKKYPNLSWEKEISETDLRRIYNDFPEVNNAEQVREKAGVIFDYYETLCKNEILRDLIAYERSRPAKNGRIAGISPGTLTEPEKNVLLNHPLKAPSYANAANDALSFTDLIYGNHLELDGKKGNAFQHSTWNALIIRYVLKETPCSEDDAISFARQGTSAHEKNNAGEQQKTENSAMDLHNNMSARQWMRNQTKWGIGPFRSMPNVSDILNKMQERANSCTKQLKIDILLWHGNGDNQETWNNLYNNNTSSNEHLVRVLN